MKSRASNLIGVTGMLTVAVGTLAGCGTTAVNNSLAAVNPCYSSGNGYYSSTPSVNTAGCASVGSNYNNSPVQTTAGIYNGPTGTVTGKILDSSTNLGLPGATVQVIGVSSAMSNGRAVNVSATTDAAGNYTLSNVPTGQQTLQVSKPDYIYLNTNGPVAVTVNAGVSVTAPSLSLTPSRLTQANGFVTAFSNFKHPRGLRLDANGDLFVVDNQGVGSTFYANWGEVQELNPNGGMLYKFGGISISELGQNLSGFLTNVLHWMQSPYGIGVDAGGNIYVADSGHDTIKQFGAGGAYLKDIQTGLKEVFDIAVMPTGNIVATDPVGGKVTMFTPGFGIQIDNLASSTNTSTIGYFPAPSTGTSGTPYASPTPNPALSAGITSGGQFHGVAVDNGNNIYVVDAAGAPGMVVRKYDQHGQALSFAGSPGFGTIGGSSAGNFENPTGIAVDNRNGNIYVVDSGNNRVQRFDADGHYLDYFGGFGTANGMFSTPIGIAVDKSGNVYVSDYNNGRVEKFGPGSPMST
ncbi:MAG: carboxypeptidase regulatory-like domain-containing protein [Nevskia sp.]|nr:carboxypeptidase regulatory-like domain-containing protein [Nevskia sp.]